MIMAVSGAMETPQHGNVSTRKCLKKSGNPSKTDFFEAFPQFLQEKRKSLKTQFLRGFLFILRRFLKFLRCFSIFKNLI